MAAQGAAGVLSSNLPGMTAKSAIQASVGSSPAVIRSPVRPPGSKANLQVTLIPNPLGSCAPLPASLASVAAPTPYPLTPNLQPPTPPPSSDLTTRLDLSCQQKKMKSNVGLV